ncbi:MAG: histidinol-phosphate transaminase [Alphaproteobacteria bacterium]|nr:histidinol-phosphate transaminase [Alphaproteobacteria bacterium]
MTQDKPIPKPGIMNIAPYVGGKSKGAEGVRVVKLSSNETPLGPSPKAKAAYIKAAETLYRYPDGSAARLREAIAEMTQLPAGQIVCGAGSDELIGMLVHAYAGPGDEVLISEHGFLMYEIYAQAVGAEVVKAKEQNLRSDVDALLAAVTERTKIVFIANPNNPTGSYINSGELARLQAGLPPHVMLAIDGAYAEYPNVPDYSDGSELVAAHDNVVMLRTFSKIYGLSALRIGWCYAPPAIADALNRVRGPFNLSTPAIEAGVAAIEDVAYTAAARAFNLRELAKLESAIRALGLTVHPSVANFVLVEFPGGPASTKAAASFLMERGLIVREVGNYGLPQCLRITVGLEEDNQAVIEALAAFQAP